MDELLIDDKKYVSSKQAAQITGYAKDYIGQLCREGRVPARLVGRSWYVLESAIQDHRFGDDVAPERPIEPVAVSSWQPAKYEPVSEDPLPTVERAPEIEPDPITEEAVEETPEENREVESFQESWKAWFDHVSTQSQGEVAPQAEPEPMQEEESPVPQELPEIGHIQIDDEAPVPIHTIYDLPPQEFLPSNRVRISSRQDEVREEREAKIVKRVRRSGTPVLYRLISVTGVVCALVALTLAITNTGYLDQYVTSISEASVFTGASTYSK